jgi:hypothetical protein
MANQFQKTWREDLILEMNELVRLGVEVPDKAFKLANKANYDGFESMSNTDVVNALIINSMMGGKQ